MPALGGGELSFTPGAPVTLVYFFAPWCGVCRLSSSNLAHLATILGPERLRIVPVALDYASAAEVQVYANEHPFPAPVALGNDKTRDAFRITAYPTYYVLDGALAVRQASVGYSTLLGLLLRVLTTS